MSPNISNKTSGLDPQDRPQVQHWEASEDQEGQRIDNFLIARLKGVPKTRIYRMLRTGEVRVNAARVANDYRLKAGDVLRIPPVRISESATNTGIGKAMGHGSAALAHSMAQKITSLWDDESIFAINKPCGLAVHGGSGVKLGVIEALRQSAQKDPNQKTESFLELVHRLDRDTSGVMLIARKRQALVEFHRQLRDGEMRKRYLALAWGSWQGGQETINEPLHKWVNAKGERWVRVQADGQQALTRVKCLAKIEDPKAGCVSLLQCEPLTGRTHQIRVHLLSHGFPIVGDPKYGNPERDLIARELGFKRMFLHAWQLRCVHPKTHETLHLRAELDEPCTNFLKQLNLETPC